MATVTIGVSSPSFVASMAIKQNAADSAGRYPLVVRVEDEAFNVDDCLTGVNSVEEGFELCGQLLELFAKADFLL